MNDMFRFAISFLLSFIEYAILARIIISWLPIPRDNQLIRILYQVTEPILGTIRRLIEKSSLGRNMGMIDLSPIVAFLIIMFIRQFLGA